MTMLAAALLEATRTPVEEVPAGEARAIGDMIGMLEDQLTRDYIEKSKRVLRDAHPKTVGLVKARFTISDACPIELRHGVFRAPGDSFDALIRFSNGSPEVQ